MGYEKIHISKDEKWHEKMYATARIKSPQYADRYNESQRREEAIRREIEKNFSHTVILEGSSPELDFAARWCWQTFGPRHGECVEWDSEYPACPMVLATEYIEDGEKLYRQVAAHCHFGLWTRLGLAKTGYDYFANQFCFETDGHLYRFVAAVPTFTHGEKYR